MKKEKNQTKENLLPKWIMIWFILSCALLVIGGVADGHGKTTEGTNAWGAALSISIMYLIVYIVFRNRNYLSKLILKIRIPLVLLSVLLGWFFAEIDELVCFPFNSLFPGVSLHGDIILTTPIYLLAHLGWFIILKRYKFSFTQALLTGGFSLGLFEVFLGGGPISILTLILWPFVIMIHGVHMIIPKILLSKEFDKFEQKDNRWKYFLGVLYPAIGGIIGIGLMYVLTGLGVK